MTRTPPTWGEAQEKIAAGEANPVDVFVYENEPTPPWDADWREQFERVMRWIADEVAEGR